MKRSFVAVYDYGMGGVWLMIEAESAEQIQERYPRLSVVSEGDPDWITAERWAEITATDGWIPVSMRFDIDRPVGWLAQSEDELTRRS
jgi:hypothetical protein